jgi:acetolactate synthase-1/2/3 large subunit
LQRGAGSPKVDRVQYVLEHGIEQFKEFRQLVLVGPQPPVAYFAYPGKKSAFTSPECVIHRLASPGEDYIVARSTRSPRPYPYATKCSRRKQRNDRRCPEEKSSARDSQLAAAVGALLPENLIVVDESMTSGRGVMAATGAPSHDWLGNPGGSIGIALPPAVGSAVACPNRRVLCLTADGSGMYTLQALWTMAREGFNVTKDDARKPNLAAHQVARDTGRDPDDCEWYQRSWPSGRAIH